MAGPLVPAISLNPTDHFSVASTNANNTKTYQCNYCSIQFTGTGTRCYVHLTGDGKGVARCASCPAAVQKALQDASNAKKQEAARKRKAEEDMEQRRRERAASNGEARPGASSAAAPAVRCVCCC